MSKGAAQIFFWGWNADYPDAENFLFLFYGPNGKVAHEGENAANYENPAFDQAFREMRLLEDGSQKAALIDRMVEILQQDAPILFWLFPAGRSGLSAWVENANLPDWYRTRCSTTTLMQIFGWQKFGNGSSCALAACRSCAWDRTPRLGSSCSARSPTGQAPAAAEVEWKEPLMINYLLRRVVYGILILLGVNLITFVLFFASIRPTTWRGSIWAAAA